MIKVNKKDIEKVIKDLEGNVCDDADEGYLTIGNDVLGRVIDSLKKIIGDKE